MKRSIFDRSTGLCLGVSALVGGLAGCSTGFGEPCDIPKVEEFRRACSPAPSGGADAGAGEIDRSSKASCAIKNFAGCETRVCLVYRGSDSFCSEACQSDDDCEGSAACRPLLGDTDLDSSACAPSEGFTPECYCVRRGDLNN